MRQGKVITARLQVNFLYGSTGSTISRSKLWAEKPVQGTCYVLVFAFLTLISYLRFGYMHCATTEYRCRREAAIHIKSLRGIFLSHRKCGTLRLHRMPGQTSWGDIRPFLELGIPFTKSLSLHISLGGVSIRIDPKIHQAGRSPKGAGE